MLPLALILRGMGHSVIGSDRSYDQGRTPAKFEYLQKQGIQLFPQDGSGVQPFLDTLVVSTAVEDTIPDVKAAKENSVPIVKRAELLASLFNEAKTRIAVAGTSGKSTVTGMIGYILQECGKAPTVMNGGIFKNFKNTNPFASALVGSGDIFVTEADESDGSIALYNPDIAVLNNIALDHKTLEELEALFSDFLAKSRIAVLNADHAGVMALQDKANKVITYALQKGDDLKAQDIKLSHYGSTFTLRYEEQTYPVKLQLPGEHNIANALAAISACLAVGVQIQEAINALQNFIGIWRRMDVVGEKGGITVIDDFAHNPDKMAASLKALKHFDGRLLIFFQPHGYGFLKLAYKELAETIAAHLDKDDVFLTVQPFYAGGTVDRSVDSTHVIKVLEEKGVRARLMEDRQAVKTHMLENAQKGDRIIIMGARDDTLAEFAQEIFDSIT